MSQDKSNIQVPQEFICPITMMMMRDPVIVTTRDATGRVYTHHYERIAIIRQLFNKPKKCCPTTGLLIEGNLSALPLDLELQQRISDFLAENSDQEFEQCDPLTYLVVDLSFIVFLCQYEKNYARQLIQKHQARLSNIISLRMADGDNLLMHVLNTPGALSLLLDPLNQMQATIAIAEKNRKGRNLLALACNTGSSGLVKMIMAKIHVDGISTLILAEDVLNNNALMIASERTPEADIENKPRAVELLLAPLNDIDAASAIQAQNKNGWNALMLACQNGDERVIGSILTRLNNVDVTRAISATNVEGRNSLMLARYKKVALMLARLNDEDAASVILAKKNHDDINLLMIVCYVIDDHLFEFLVMKIPSYIRSSAFIQQDAFQNTLFHHMASANIYNNLSTVIRYCDDLMTALTMKNIANKTPIDIAIEKGEVNIIRLLVTSLEKIENWVEILEGKNPEAIHYLHANNYIPAKEVNPSPPRDGKKVSSFLSRRVSHQIATTTIREGEH